ncbi:phosphoribosylaminoimidazolesuccinocarboxamide synthase [Candidatus Micrarchaeota archaeon]|nr:phosphoribosylaminoimidazolesuccinocarboxamide synthase [Candidatus Micrarchaeota archaeon]
MEVITKTDLSLPLYARGKVRDTYDLGDKLLMITTDRLSAFDVVFPNGIPYKGIVLNEISNFWFKFTANIVPNHLLMKQDLDSSLKQYENVVKRRYILVKKAKPLAIECVVRGYLSGSGWKEYKENKTVCGIKLPDGLKESDQLPEPIFTPATKAQSGHDINISHEEAMKIVGRDNFEKVMEYSIKIYDAASKHANEKGILIADTKFEFGIFDDEIILIDEVLTPDSSRFWPKDVYQPGRPQKSFDKQFVRDYLERLNWNKQPPAPKLPEDIVKGTTERYIEAYERLTGDKFVR